MLVLDWIYIDKSFQGNFIFFFQLDEAKRQDLWDTKFHSVPLNVDPSIKIPTMFIDPVVDVFRGAKSLTKKLKSFDFFSSNLLYETC